MATMKAPGSGAPSSVQARAAEAFRQVKGDGTLDRLRDAAVEEMENSGAMAQLQCHVQGVLRSRLTDLGHLHGGRGMPMKALLEDLRGILNKFNVPDTLGHAVAESTAPSTEVHTQAVAALEEALKTVDSSQNMPKSDSSSQKVLTADKMDTVQLRTSLKKDGSVGSNRPPTTDVQPGNTSTAERPTPKDDYLALLDSVARASDMSTSATQPRPQSPVKPIHAPVEIKVAAEVPPRPASPQDDGEETDDTFQADSGSDISSVHTSDLSSLDLTDDDEDGKPAVKPAQKKKKRKHQAKPEPTKKKSKSKSKASKKSKTPQPADGKRKRGRGAEASSSKRRKTEPESDSLCPVCGLNDDPEHADPGIVCDGCERGFHMRCVGLEELPDTDWFCLDCLKKRAAPTKDDATTSPWHEGLTEDVYIERLQEGRWYVASIIEVNAGDRKAKIHFVGWKKRYDEWISFDEEKVLRLPADYIPPRKGSSRKA